ncbi:helix-turn-helix domain-containing protein [Sphingopyxis granuli]|uniref:TetR/AcrR family transcriptional regulator n=1 Tax=Sphingopyxis granuli TaxID=267128 RepID=UPI00301D573A
MPRVAKPAVAAASNRLEVADWVHAGLLLLADQGIVGVRVEALARGLGVTKGSFYWHFKDREALLREMLQSWRRRATLSVIERLQGRATTPVSRLDSLLQLPFASPKAQDGASVELAIRLWARQDATARAVLEEIDMLRMGFICAIFEELGFGSDDAQARASLVYGFMREGATLPSKLHAETLTTLISGLLVNGAVPEPASA